MHHLCDALDVVDRPENVAGVRASHETGAISEQLFQILRIELWVLAVFWDPPFQSQSLTFCYADPGCDVGFVVDSRDNELVSCFEFQGLG